MKDKKDWKTLISLYRNIKLAQWKLTKEEWNHSNIVDYKTKLSDQWNNMHKQHRRSQVGKQWGYQIYMKDSTTIASYVWKIQLK